MGHYPWTFAAILPSWWVERGEERLVERTVGALMSFPESLNMSCILIGTGFLFGGFRGNLCKLFYAKLNAELMGEESPLIIVTDCGLAKPVDHKNSCTTESERGCLAMELIVNNRPSTNNNQMDLNVSGFIRLQSCWPLNAIGHNSWLLWTWKATEGRHWGQTTAMSTEWKQPCKWLKQSEHIHEMYNFVYTCSITCVLALTIDTNCEHDVASSLGRFLCFAVAYNAEEDLGNGSMSCHVHVNVLIHASRCAIVADCFGKLMIKRSWHTYAGKDGW